MRCPYCETQLTEESPGCPSCGLSIDKADHFFGSPPRLEIGITDLAGILSGRKRSAIAASAREFTLQFPQCHADVVIGQLPPETPAAAWTWWIFNRARSRDAVNMAGENRDVLLYLDAKVRRPWLTIGYGLEPFISRDVLKSALVAGRESLLDGAFHTAAEQILSALRQSFVTILNDLPRITGAPEKTWTSESTFIPATPRPDTMPVIAGY